MPHIANVGRRAFKTRALILSIYAVLILGGLTMVVPFWLMLSTSITSNVDSQDFSFIPAYLYRDEALFQKFEESAYNEDPKLYNYCVPGANIGDFHDVKKPPSINKQRVADFDHWKAGLPNDYLLTLHGYSVTKPKISLLGAHLYQQFLSKRYHGSIAALNKAYSEDRDYFDLQVPNEQWYQRIYQPLRDRRFRELVEFKTSLPGWFKTPVPVEGTYVEFLTNKYNQKPETFAKRYNDPTIKSLTDLTCPARLPKNPAFAVDWIDYVRSNVPFQYVRIDQTATPEWHAYLAQAHHHNLAAYHHFHIDDPVLSKVKSFDAVPLPKEPPTAQAALTDWGGFIEQAVDPKYVRLDTPEIRYRQWLKRKFGTIQAMNRAYGTTYLSFGRVQFPILQSDWSAMESNKSYIRDNFLIRNYRDVAAYMAVHGRSLWVTLIFVAGAIFVTLTVNPMAAFALSRYNLPSTYKILLFCLATMAFPPAVTAIPNFLLMKELHLLNTLWALILPTAAAGFNIFLLKGFFDGLPSELYEAAEIDGANEFQMFTRICLPMSKPVLAVIGLWTFTATYGSFMWAFVVCQDQKWWTLMVFLQQMESWAPQSMIFAALVLAAIPTLLVFIFAQDVIMRGIIIPVEK